MIRLVAATATAAILLAACGGEPVPAAPVEPIASAESSPPPGTPDPTALPLPTVSPSGAAAMNMMCGGATFRVAFVDTH
ncbi:MAG: hypothetical protein Q8R82_14565, partial [Hyphomonadaceae bacterium]|nr:hypothetical protein [Hyphomonadaceae bacterium]